MASRPKRVCVRLMLEPKMAMKLRQAGEPHWRKLPSEIVYRLQQSLASGQPAFDHAIYGWNDESLRHNRALGQAVGLLASRLERAAGLSGDPDRDRATVLAMLKLAVPLLLDQLAAKGEYLTEEYPAVATAFAKSLYSELVEAKKPGGAIRRLLPGQKVLTGIARELMTSAEGKSVVDR